MSLLYLSHSKTELIACKSIEVSLQNNKVSPPLDNLDETLIWQYKKIKIACAPAKFPDGHSHSAHALKVENSTPSPCKRAYFFMDPLHAYVLLVCKPLCIPRTSRDFVS